MESLPARLLTWYRRGMAKDKQPTNGPYSWGNGPQPKKCACMEAIPALRRGKVRLAARLLRIGVRSRLGMI